MTLRRSRKANRPSKKAFNNLFSRDSVTHMGRSVHTLECLEARQMLAVDTSNSSSATLNIYIDGTRVTIPANVGVNANDSHASVFTTANNGKVFFDADSNVTLGDFFTTWRTNAGLAGNNANANLSATQLMTSITDRDSTLQVFVNGQQSTSFAGEQIDNGDNVVLVYSSNTVLSLNTNFGSIVVELYDSQKANTVANFLNYVNDGDYINSIFHRTTTLATAGVAVIQGGGFKTNSTTFTNTNQFTNVPTDAPIQNQPGISNLRGTIAMAKTSDPDSATSQFFINIDNANAVLDDPDNSGGFTVFGQVLDMTSSDTIWNLPRRNQGGVFSALPVAADNTLAVVQSIEGQGEVSGFKFLDVDGDGVRDNGEAGVGGITVWVDANKNGSLDSGENSTTTASDGFYEFQLEPGSYVIRSAVSSGFNPTNTVVPVTVEIGGSITLNFGEIDDARPVSVNDAYSVNEDGVLTVSAANGLLQNDTDAENDALIAGSVTQPANGTVLVSADGSFTYTPNPHFFGTDTFTYKAADDLGPSTIPATVTITVVAQPDPPTATGDTLSVTKNTGPHSVNVLANDSSAPDVAQTITLDSVTQGSNGGTVAINGSSVNYTPAVGFVGTETFTYTIKDSDNLTATATVTVTVLDTSNNNSISGFVYIDKDKDGTRDTGERGLPGSLLTLTGTDNLGNSVLKTAITADDGSYSFTNLRSGTYKIVQQQPKATTDSGESTSILGASTATNDEISNIVLVNNNNFTENNFGEKLPATSTSITWYMNNSGSVQSSTRETVAKAEEKAGNTALAAAIRAGATELPNRAPVTVNDTFTVSRNGQLTVTAANGVLKNDTDPDQNALTSEVVTNPANGTLTLNADGSFVYKPNANFTGTDTFTYQASDGTLTKTGTVTITVNTVNVAPVGNTDTYSTVEDSTLTVPIATGVLANDTDADGHTLTAAVVGNPSHGSVTLNADGSFTYTPTANYNGADSFTYRANDGTANSATTTVNITVTAVADAPVANNDSYTVAENQTLTRTASNGVRANDTDADGTTLTISLLTTTTNGTLTLNADGSFSYTPNENFSGVDTFTYQATDGTTTSSPATVTITVEEGNDRPQAANDSYVTSEDQVLTVPFVTGLLSNDTDADGTTLGASVLVQPQHGTLTLSSDGSFIYTPAANYNGSDSFTYRVTDGSLTDSATVNITINPVNDAPVAVANSYTTDEDQTLTVPVATGVLANDTDVEGSVLTASVLMQPTSGSLTLSANGSFTYQPVANFFGSDSFTYQVSDGNAVHSATVSITVNAINDPPHAEDDSYAIDEDQTLTVVVAESVLINDTDLEGNTLTATVTVQPAHGTLSLAADGSFTYTPASNFNGADSFTYQVSDGTVNDTATVNITVNAIDDAPTTLADSYNIDEDETLIIPAATGVLANDTDVEGSTLNATGVTPTSSGTTSLGTDGSFTYTPNGNFSGTDSFTYTAADSSTSSAPTTVTITVTAVPDAPQATADSYNTTVDHALTVDIATGILANDIDADGDTISAVLVANVSNGTLSLGADGSFLYTPESGFEGTDRFTYRATDGTLSSPIVTVEIEVEAVQQGFLATIDEALDEEDWLLV